MESLKTILISVFVIVIIFYFLPSLYFAEAPSENPSVNWWAALSIIVTISFAVIAMSVVVLLRERGYEERVASLEKNSAAYRILYDNMLSFLSNILDVQNVSKEQRDGYWRNIEESIAKITDVEILKLHTLKYWSTVAWKQGDLEAVRTLREKAYELDKNDFRNRVMLCSILTLSKNPDNTRIENILNNTDLESDNITDGDKDHFYNVQGVFYKKNGKFEEATETFKKSLELNFQTWPFYEYILTLIMRKEIKSKFIKSEIERIKKIPKSKWLDDTVLYQKAFRLFANGFINESKIDEFYNYLTPLMISELIHIYDNDYVKLMFFNFYSQISKKYNNRELNLLYLTFYKLFGVYDNQADDELQKQETLDEINKKIIMAHMP